MSETAAPANTPDVPMDETSALFASLVLQQANMATMLLGKTAHPETGKPIKDLEAAKLFIDHLEVLEKKTKGNLAREESALLKQTLMTLRLAFVEAVNSPEETATAERTAAGSAPPGGEPKPADESGKAGAGPSEEESRKKFTKKY